VRQTILWSPAAQERRLVHFLQHGAVRACRVLSTFPPGHPHAPGRFNSPDVPAQRCWLTACVSNLDKPA